MQDPNITLANDIHPLMKIYTFCPAENLHAMRNALLEAGATEDDELKERWAIRRSHDACEKAWLRNFHMDPR